MGALDDRMKNQYENRTRYYLPRRTYTIIRIDGRAFHTYTKHLIKPFDFDLADCFNVAARRLCQQVQGTKFGYLQSDEASFLLTDFDTVDTAAWFDGNIQKIVSVTASIFTSAFEQCSQALHMHSGATFDARVFTIPDYVEVENYFIGRQKDCERNSISSLAQTLYSAKQLHKKNCSEMQELCFDKGRNWNDEPTASKSGRVVTYESERWNVTPAPIFTKNREFLTSRIPQHWKGE